jgi:hypothetical protein
MIKSSDIEQLRSPIELREFVTQLKKDVEADESEFKRGIQKQGLYKQFVDEIMPLSSFAILVYPKNYKIKPILGNQGYDALVFNDTGEEVDRVEITRPHDGSDRATDGRLVATQGYGQIHVGEPGDDFEALFSHVLSVCSSKAEKDYSDCTLVISIAPMKPFKSFKEQYENQLESLVSKIAKFEFKAKRTYLHILPDRVINING